MGTKEKTYSITKRITNKGINGMVIEEKSVTIEGNDIDKCKKIFYEVWNNGD